MAPVEMRVEASRPLVGQVPPQERLGLGVDNRLQVIRHELVAHVGDGDDQDAEQVLVEHHQLVVLEEEQQDAHQVD